MIRLSCPSFSVARDYSSSSCPRKLITKTDSDTANYHHHYEHYCEHCDILMIIIMTLLSSLWLSSGSGAETPSLPPSPATPRCWWATWPWCRAPRGRVETDSGEHHYHHCHHRVGSGYFFRKSILLWAKIHTSACEVLVKYDHYLLKMDSKRMLIYIIKYV